MQAIVADSLERDSDDRLALVTVTGVHVDPDLRHGVVFYATRDDADDDAGRRGARRSARVGPKRHRPPSPHEADAAAALRARPGDGCRMAHRRDPQSGTRADAVRLATSIGRRRPSRPPTRWRWRATSRPTATRSARCSGCTTCASRPASRRSPRGRRRSWSRRTTRTLPGLEIGDAARGVPRGARRDDHLRLRIAGASRRAWRRRRATPRELIVLDHHLSNDRYGTINVIDVDAAATAVVVRELAARSRLGAHPRRRDVSLHRARHRHRPLPVPVDDARSVRARRGVVALRPADPGAVASAVRRAPPRVSQARRRVPGARRTRRGRPVS